MSEAILLLLMYSTPVALAALGETVTQRSGVINIGLEGTMLFGAFFAMYASFASGNAWVGLGVGALTGAIASLAFGAFTIFLGSDQVVVGTAINLLALGVTGTLFRARFGQTGQLLSVPRLPSWHGVDAVLLGLLVSVPLVYVLIYRTRWGLAIRASGEYPKSAEAAGFSVQRLRLAAVAIGGVFGGIAGAYLSIGITGSFAENMTAGRGFVAIAMVTFGRWRPGYVFAAALLIGFAESLQFKFQSYGWHVPFQLMIALPYAIALIVLVLVGKGTRAPASLAEPYRRER